jgi:hypothetical protein
MCERQKTRTSVEAGQGTHSETSSNATMRIGESNDAAEFTWQSLEEAEILRASVRSTK